jgi:hypothetical protein
MRRLHLRFTLLGLMALIALMAIGFGIWVAAMRSGRRAQVYRAKAEELTRAAQDHRNKAAGYNNRAIIDEVAIDFQRERAQDESDRRGVRLSREALEWRREMVRREDLLAGYYRDLARKYQHAAGRPWEPLAPDPPPPGPRPVVLRRR